MPLLLSEKNTGAFSMEPGLVPEILGFSSAFLSFRKEFS